MNLTPYDLRKALHTLHNSVDSWPKTDTTDSMFNRGAKCGLTMAMNLVPRDFISINPAELQLLKEVINYYLNSERFYHDNDEALKALQIKLSQST